MSTIRIEADTTRVDCPNCARTAEEEIKKITGVTGAKIDFLNSRINYSFDGSVIESGALKKQIEDLGHFKFITGVDAGKRRLPSRSL